MNKVTYLDHSGFLVTTPGVVLVFDYYRDPAHALEKELAAQPDCDVVFLVSHHHPDHFNDDIFNLAQNHRRTFVLSDDIFSKLVPDKGLSVAWLKAGDPSIELPRGLSVRAFGSTDAGVSYAVTDPEGNVIFHAGDLNDWHWQDESTQHEVMKADNAFRTITARIAREIPHMKIVMFPVDTRLGTDFGRGARIFTEEVSVDNFFPMHLWKHPDMACDFSSYIATPDTTRCHCLDHPGNSALIE